MYGIEEKHIKSIQSVFKKYDIIEKVILYGSRAKGNYRYNSDIDLTIIGKNIDLNILLRLNNELDDLLLPYEIDLSILNRIENNDLLDHIKRVGVTFYEKNTD
jgi:predicted nucleotidyltransferase